ncbi:hypothetical protein ACFFV7_21810 [Nonomuraea spiralis]|uniref:Uncharacterized protein n=1 Tax=Nonomuraea spiralis TaxID=46182 RepID=A0ABV5IH26_9ACTN|nr:hypothetical protein [Nonomuraea spiralis]GGS97288.1 hypothetical protein GCM10010176_046400 [Nonomuraea spiralis]
MPTNPAPWLPSDEPPGPYDVEIERARLRELRSRLPDAARPLDGVLPSLAGLTVTESAFTSFTYSLALAYGEVEAFTMVEVRHRVEDVVRIQDGMTTSITTWENAERASAVVRR